MFKRRVAGFVLGTTAVLFAGVLFASNMAFKLKYILDGPGNGVSRSGTNTISLPYFPMDGLARAGDLRDDINGGPGRAGPAVQIAMFDKSTNSLVTYDGFSGPNFPLVAGEGYFVQMDSTVVYIIVGSHDPSTAVTFDAAGAGSLDGTNFYAYPYHATAGMASELQGEIGVVQNIQRFVRSNDTIDVYTGSRGSSMDFNLVSGEAVFVKVSATVNFVPPHY